jgi:hypothetical protein
MLLLVLALRQAGNISQKSQYAYRPIATNLGFLCVCLSVAREGHYVRFLVRVVIKAQYSQRILLLKYKLTGPEGACQDLKL